MSLIGNGSFLAIFARFKVFRNFPNILFANLSLVDLVNALVNVSLFAITFVLYTPWLRGKTWVIISTCFHLQFTLLNLVSMFALMLDRFLVLYLDLKYFTWKTTKKAKIAVLLMWMFCTTVTALSSTSFINMDFGDNVPLGESRGKIFEKRKPFVGSLMALFTAASTVLGILTTYAIYQKKKQVRKTTHLGKTTFFNKVYSKNVRIINI